MTFEPMYDLESGGKRLGPFDRKTITTLWECGRLGPDACVSLTGVGEWSAIGNWIAGRRELSPAQMADVAPVAPARKAAEPGRSVTGAVLVKPQRSRGIYVMFGLFFGLLGVHDFYAGHIGRACCFLVVSLVAGMGATHQPKFGVAVVVVVAIFILLEICTEDRDGDGDPLA